MTNHIGLSADPLYLRAIVCGAPERAQKFAQTLEGSRLLSQNREYHCYGGHFDKQFILIVSHGVGAAGAAICFQELAQVGVRAIIRVGTAGGLYDELHIGDIVVATAAARLDGVTPLMVPTGWPAVSDLALTDKLIAELKGRGWQGRAGTIVTSDLFYPGVLPEPLQVYQKAGAIAVEMECSALYVVAGLRQMRAASVLVCDGNPLKWSEGVYDPRPERLAASLDLAYGAALAALAKIKIV